MFDRFFGASKSTSEGAAALYLHNTASGGLEAFTLAPSAARVRMYCCGPTVYGRQHIGNLSMYVFTDVLRRTLEYNGFPVKQVINITDVGHLVSDSDDGEDKMTKGLKAKKLPLTLENMRAFGEENTAAFLDDLAAININVANIDFPRASDHIPGMIAMIRSLEDKSYAYKTTGGVYFDTSMYPEYGKLGNINIEGQREGARVDKVSEKRNPSDFALWKFDKKIGWDSPWGKGFPGWHIECSAMIHKILGEPIDIHTGGIEHIPIHHNNEIAQSTCATGKRTLARFWMHREHIRFEGGKIAKSLGNVVYLSDVIERGFTPLALRYLFLGAHYRSAMNFTWESLEAAETALTRLAAHMRAPERGIAPERYMTRFHVRINDDLDTPGAIAVLWEMVKDESLQKADIRAGLLAADTVLGLDLARIGDAAASIAVETLPDEIRQLIAERDAARTARNWARADEIRDEAKAAGYSIEDGADGQIVRNVQ